MSPSEFDVVMTSDLCHASKMLYSYLRRHMDYKTGLVGTPRRISYQAIREFLEVIPARGSTSAPYKPSNQQINRLLRKLEGYGFIERKHKDHLKESMVFKLVFATTDLNRPNEERQGSDMEAPTRGAPQQNPVKSTSELNMSDTMSDKGATWEERHTSVPSDIKPSLSNARAREASQNSDFSTGQELSFSDQFKQTAKLTGLTLTEEQLSGLFDAFRFHNKHRSTMRSPADWLAEWRVWCGREKSYGRPKNQKHSRTGGNQRAENPTARLLRESREAAAELARTGYYDQREQFDDDTQF